MSIKHIRLFVLSYFCHLFFTSLYYFLLISCQLNVRQYIPTQTADTLSAAKTAAPQHNYIASVFTTYPRLTPIQLITHHLNFLSTTFLRASYHAFQIKLFSFLPSSLTFPSRTPFRRTDTFGSPYCDPTNQTKSRAFSI